MNLNSPIQIYRTMNKRIFSFIQWFFFESAVTCKLIRWKWDNLVAWWIVVLSTLYVAEETTCASMKLCTKTCKRDIKLRVQKKIPISMCNKCYKWLSTGYWVALNLLCSPEFGYPEEIHLDLVDNQQTSFSEKSCWCNVVGMLSGTVTVYWKKCL